MVTWQRHKVIKASQQRGKWLIAPSVRGTMAVHLLINTLIIMSLLLSELSALHPRCLKPPPDSPASWFFFSPLKGSDFLILPLFSLRFVCSARLSVLTLMGPPLRMLMRRHFHNTSTN